ncbi:ADAMTS-like protein 3 [Ctenocephalides felis]|uniref:ADAMTS-like protein 3 n=1 Tax=Ctenocephalides felis TaxID=7515 RepID=UPI000E6E2FF7|nr:ADAMTS-like protein 3 [Ctenocephalides felis]
MSFSIIVFFISVAVLAPAAWLNDNNFVTTTQDIIIYDNFRIDDNSNSNWTAASDHNKEWYDSWSRWSQWSTCSRSCDGGVSHQLRRCIAEQGCQGEPLRYKICNMQPCPEYQDFRAHQCSAYDGMLYEGVLWLWSPHYDDSEPCALTCRGRPAAQGSSIDEDAIMVVQMAPRVQDGTRCRPGSLDMCIHGQCQHVGCDLRIGSSKKVDVCGICGGDGKSCGLPLYHWVLSTMSHCSATCGGGYKMSRPTCRNRVTGVDVEDQLCNETQRPDMQVIQCNMIKCPAKWMVSEWGECSASCEGGVRIRVVNCVEEDNGTIIKVPDSNCRLDRPRTQEPCGLRGCSRWETRNWSGCSVSCGSGIRVRGVECVNLDGAIDQNCDESKMPERMEACSTGIACPIQHHLELDNEKEKDRSSSALYHTQPLIQLFPPAVAERLMAKQAAPSEATFIKDYQWSACSVTCGEGVRRREFHCKIFLEFSQTIAIVPDEKCPGIKPLPETERCTLEPCSFAYGFSDAAYPNDLHSVRVAGTPGKTYSWQEQGYTHCSASCLGGVQELIINCVRDDTDKIASPYMCSPETRPENRIRTCNDHPCPPRWNYSNFQPCTKSCGIGIQTREVNCIHEVTRGGGNTVVVPNNMCPQPPPPDRQYCNVLDCPARWKIGEWGRCNKSCGGGMKMRHVSCMQVMAQNHEVERPASACATARPQDRKSCNNKNCVSLDKPHIAMNNSSFIQHDLKRKKVTLKIGGAGTVFYGTHVKIKCPVKKFNKTRILWTKDDSQITKSNKYRVSRKGVLRIQEVTYRDGGIYTCIAGQSYAKFVLAVKTKPGEYSNSKKFDAGQHRTGDNQAKLLYQPDDESNKESNEPKSPKPQRTAANRIVITTILQSENSTEKALSSHIFEQNDGSDTAAPGNVAVAASSAERPVPNISMLISTLKMLIASELARLLGNQSNYENSS